LALVVAIITIRTKGVAFAMVTLAVGQVLFVFVFQTDMFGGEGGLVTQLPTSLGPKKLWYLIAGLAVLTIVALRLIVSSPLGLILTAMREDVVRLQFLGVDPRRVRVVAFTIAGAAAGLAGALYACAAFFVAPEALSWTRSGEPIIMALLGGIHSFYGPVVGAFALTGLTRVLSDTTSAYPLVLGIILISIVLIAPKGILGLVKQLGLSTWVRRKGRGSDED
jgi:branched-chain amino acid transport system permease protein